MQRIYNKNLYLISFKGKNVKELSLNKVHSSSASFFQKIHSIPGSDDNDFTLLAMHFYETIGDCLNFCKIIN